MSFNGLVIRRCMVPFCLNSDGCQLPPNDCPRSAYSDSLGSHSVSRHPAPFLLIRNKAADRQDDLAIRKKDCVSHVLVNLVLGDNVLGDEYRRELYS